MTELVKLVKGDDQALVDKPSVAYDGYVSQGYREAGYEAAATGAEAPVEAAADDPNAPAAEGGAAPPTPAAEVAADKKPAVVSKKSS